MNEVLPISNAARAAREQIDTCWRLVMLFAFSIVIFMLPEATFAQAAAPNMITTNAIQGVMCNVVIMLTGITGKAIATFMAVTLGISALLGKISWGQALLFAVGLAIMFGAASIVTALGGDSSPCVGATAVST